MTPDDLAAAGRSLFGDRHGWQADLARAIPMDLRTLRRMLAGERAVSPRTETRVRELLADQVVERAVARFEELRAQHGQPAEIVLTARDDIGDEAREALAAQLRARGVAVRLA